MNMRKFLPMFAFALLLLLPGTALAEGGIDSVVLASDWHYPDALVAGVAADKIGAPLLLTKPGQVPRETLDEIEDLNVSKIYIIGGPYAVSEPVESELSEKYEVIRLWGMTRYGTSAAVAEYFWQESSHAVIVWDILGIPVLENSRIIAKARDLAQAYDAPLLLIHRNIIPEVVSDALINLSVQDVTLVGDVGSRVEKDLDGMGINVTERIEGGISDMIEEMKERIKDKIGKNRPLVVIAIGNWSDLIRVPYRPNGTSRHISSEDQIDTLIEEINRENYTRIYIVGKPDLAETIYSRLAEAGINATLVSGRPYEVAASVMRLERAVIRLRIQLHKLSRNVTLLLMKAENLEERAEGLVNSLNATVRRLEQAFVSLNGSAIMERAEQLRDKIRGNLSLKNYENALAAYKILENHYEQLRLRNIESLRAEITEAISREKLGPILIRRAARQ